MWKNITAVFIFMVAIMLAGQLHAPQTVLAADVWIQTDQSGGSTHEWYVQTHRIEENASAREFTVPLKLVVNGKLGNNRLQLFRLNSNGIWYMKQKNSSHDFTYVGGNVSKLRNPSY